MSEVKAWEWAVFGVTVLIMLGVDIFAHRKGHADTRRGAIVWSAVWIAVGLAFCGFVWWRFHLQAAQEYLAAYLIEKSLSLDNLFVFLIIFKTIQIPKDNQRKALLWGVLGALVFRAIFIFLGAAALREWAWVEYIFAGILVIAAIHTFREDPAKTKENKIVKWMAEHLRVTHNTHDDRFIVRDRGKLKATPLLVAIIGLELTDILFAIDSVPAAFSVSRNEFIIYSSNVFAILGLRALYIVLARTIADLAYLHYGLAAILLFAGGKMITHEWVEIPPLLSVAIIAVCLIVAVVASVWRDGGEDDLRHMPPERDSTRSH